MLPFFSPKQNGTEPVIGRVIITAFAILFLLCGLAKALPSPNQLTAFFQKGALAEYETVTQTSKERKPVLEEFCDRPSDDRTDSAESSAADRPSADTQRELPKESGSV